MDAPPPSHLDFEPEDTSSHYQSEILRPMPQQVFDPTRTRHYKPSYSSTSSQVPNHRSPTHPDPVAGPSYEEIVFRTSSHGHGRGSLGEEARIINSSVRENGVTVNEDDGGVGEGRLRTPFEPPFSNLLTDESSHAEGSRPREDRRDLGFVELGPLNTHEPQTSVANGGLRTDEPPSQASPSNAPGNKVGNKRSFLDILFPCGICFSDRGVNHDQRNLPIVPSRPLGGPVLDPAHRYCPRDGIVKPYRAHHCRSCGTVSGKIMLTLKS
jgi:palmitoyltransferase